MYRLRTCKHKSMICGMIHTEQNLLEMEEFVCIILFFVLF